MDKNLNLGVALKILQLLKSKPRQTPQTMTKALGVSESSVKSALVYLFDLYHVRKLGHGLYIITESGVRTLEENLKRLGESMQ